MPGQGACDFPGRFQSLANICAVRFTGFLVTKTFDHVSKHSGKLFKGDILTGVGALNRGARSLTGGRMTKI